MESGEQPMADSQCIKKAMRNHPGGKHSLDTGGIGECMAEGADTGGVESCGREDKPNCGPKHREEQEQDNEECKPPHSTIESEKQVLPAVSKDSLYINRSSSDTWDLVGAAGLDFSETPDNEDHGEQPMADTQCTKKGMRDQPGGKHSLDTGGTGECIAEGADTGGVESCGQDVNLGSQVEPNPANLGFWEYADQTQVDSSPADVIAALSADHIADADDHVPLEHEPCWKVVQHSTDFCQSNVMSPPFASALPYLPPFADSDFPACILDSRRRVQEDHKGRAKIIL
jgi:hypothetical protein